MSWKTVQADLQRLRAKHGRDRSLIRKMPDLSVSQNVAPLSNTIPGGVAPKREKGPVPGILVGTLHKQGPMVLSKSDLQYAGGRKV